MKVTEQDIDERMRENSPGSMPLDRPLHLRGRRHKTRPRIALDVPLQAPLGRRWSDNVTTRLQVQALMQSLNASILASTSATSALEEWCRARGIADKPQIVAERLENDREPLTAYHACHLNVSSTDVVRHRKVRLRCSPLVLSESDNWYVANRLTETMNRLLDRTDQPFGKVIRPLGPYRRTLTVMPLWQTQLEECQEECTPTHTNFDARFAIPDALFRHEALVYTREHLPIALVYETYMGALLSDHPGSGTIPMLGRSAHKSEPRKYPGRFISWTKKGNFSQNFCALGRNNRM